MANSYPTQAEIDRVCDEVLSASEKEYYGQLCTELAHGGKPLGELAEWLILTNKYYAVLMQRYPLWRP